MPISAAAVSVLHGFPAKRREARPFGEHLFVSVSPYSKTCVSRNRTRLEALTLLVL